METGGEGEVCKGGGVTSVCTFNNFPSTGVLLMYESSMAGSDKQIKQLK